MIKCTVSSHIDGYVKLISNHLAYKNTSNLIPCFKTSRIVTPRHVHESTFIQTVSSAGLWQLK